jgi:ubiquinone/menaquinone biosynthesis C-methylase UbiE
VSLTDIESQKAGQAEHFDAIDNPEFEINRPHDASRIYRYLMDYKMERVMDLLGHPLSGARVVVICCGSGMDAEYLARQGAKVTATDISAGCLARAAERMRRYGLNYELEQADAESLPFDDWAYDYAFVHDGLHHLPNPDSAISEMARVARVGILLTEPADAALTALAIRAGAIEAYEEAGNFVVRFSAKRLTPLCRSLGLTDIRHARYLMKYGHPPAEWWRRFDHPLPQALARGAFRALGAGIMSPLGNKLALVALRAEAAGV